MSTIVTRAGKGNALTHAEMDANFTNLNTDKIETSEVGISVQAYSANLDEYAAVNPTAAGLALLDDADATAQRATLGLVIGTNVQAYGVDIATVSASQAEVEAGTESALRSMSPLRLAQAIVAIGDTTPVGTIIHVATSTAPTGYLKANGAEISRTTYANLFTAIGTTFGVGNGSTTFLIPDLRGEFVRGWDDARGVDTGRALGSSQADELKSHTHIVSDGHFSSPYNVNAYPFAGAGGAAVSGATGGTETRPRNIALLACIKY